MNCVVYVAYGKKYIKEAIRSAESVKIHASDLPVCLITTGKSGGRAGPFSAVVKCKPLGGVPSLVNRVHMLVGGVQKLEPYKRFLFLDADTYVLSDLRPLFGLLDRFDVAATHAPHRNTGPGLHDMPLGYPHFNCGVILFDRSTFGSALLDWERLLRENYAVYGNNDQPAFGEAIYRGDARVYVLPPEFNVRIATCFCAYGKVHIVHGRHRRMEAAIKTINHKLKPRIWDARKRQSYTFKP